MAGLRLSYIDVAMCIYGGEVDRIVRMTDALVTPKQHYIMAIIVYGIARNEPMTSLYSRVHELRWANSWQGIEAED